MNSLNCFICLAPVASMKVLSYHVRSVHNLLTLDKFICNQNGCVRSFHNSKCLFKHIRLKHSNETETCENELDNLSSFPVNDESYNDTAARECVNDVTSKPDSISQHELAFILKLYERLNLTRKDIVSIMNDIRVLSNVSNSNSINFNGIDTEYLIKNQLISDGIYIEPDQFVIGYGKDKTQLRNGSYHLVPTTVSAQYISLKETFLRVFSSLELFEMAIQYMRDKCSSELLNDLKDGTKCSNMESNVFPFVIYYDEVECGNPLGSHKGVHKIGAVYVSLRCFPTHFYSSVKNIHICCLFPATDRTYLCKVIEKIVPDIISLCTEGLLIHNKRIIFKFCGVLGDNLGLNQFLGFVESFSANYYCRFCTAYNLDCQNMVKEDHSLLRNVQNYTDDLDKPVSECGVNYESLLNTIPNYHVIENSFVDLMHDFSEGVGNWGMFSVIEYYVRNKILSLNTINERIKLFPLLDATNRPPPIGKNQFAKGVLSYSASEMMNLIIFFALIVGDLIPSTCKIWQYYLKLKTLFSILCDKNLSRDHASQLSILIEEHHVMYKELFHKHLKPKHHLLTHYPSSLLKVGPFGHYWSMRFESHHTLLKCVANVVKSRVNLCKSIAIRHMFLFASELFKLKNNAYTDISEVGPIDNDAKSYVWIKWRGIKFMKGSVVWVGSDDDTALPIFGRIDQIRVHNEKCVVFDVIFLTTNYLDEHYDAYAVEVGIEKQVVDVEDCSPPLNIVSRNKVSYVNNNNM